MGVRSFLKAIPLAVVLPLTLCAVSVGPDDAASNVSKWLVKLGISGVPGWLHEKTADHRLIIGGLCLSVFYAAWAWGLPWVRRKRRASPAHDKAPSVMPLSEGGRGGSGEIFGSGTITGGRGGRVGPGGAGRGGDGGSGVIHGDGLIIGSEGGSVDGAEVWYPPAQSGYIDSLLSQGQTPDFGVQYPGAGGASAGWNQKNEIVRQIRETYFRETGEIAKISKSKIRDVPLEYINEKLSQVGHPWRASYDKEHWYCFYVPSAPE